MNSVGGLRKMLCLQKQNGSIYPLYRLSDAKIPVVDLAGLNSGELGTKIKYLELNVVDVGVPITRPQEGVKAAQEANTSERPSSEPVQSQHPDLLRDILGRDDPRILSTLDKLKAKLSGKGQSEAQEALLAVLYHRLPLEQVERWLQRERQVRFRCGHPSMLTHPLDTLGNKDGPKSPFVFSLGRTPARDHSDYHELARLVEKFGLADDESISDEARPALPDYILASLANGKTKKASADPRQYNPWNSSTAVVEGGLVHDKVPQKSVGQDGHSDSESQAASRVLPSYLEAVRTTYAEGASVDDTNSTHVAPVAYIDDYIISIPRCHDEKICKLDLASNISLNDRQLEPSATTAQLLREHIAVTPGERPRYRVGKGAGMFASIVKKDEARPNATGAKIASLKDSIPAGYPMAETLKAEIDKLTVWMTYCEEADTQSEHREDSSLELESVAPSDGNTHSATESERSSRSTLPDAFD